MYQAKELECSWMSWSQKTHQKRLREASWGLRGIGALRKKRTSESFLRKRDRKVERDFLWLGKYLWRRPWSWFMPHALQNSNSLFCFCCFFIFFSPSFFHKQNVFLLFSSYKQCFSVSVSICFYF